MTAKEIISLIENPSLLDKSTLVELNSLLEEYPFFQTVRLLYLLNLYREKDLSFAPELRKMAISTTDRKQLFYLFEQNKYYSQNTYKLESLEQKDKSTVLVDHFLKELQEGSKGQVQEVQEGQEEPYIKEEKPVKAKEQAKALALNDYFSYLLLDDRSGNEEIQPMKHQDVIDRFLETDEKKPVKIVLEKSDENIPEELTPIPDLPSEESFFSETLARIYLKQKKYDKALEIIRKLNLLYPEKNIYFADQIRFLEKLIINTKKT